MHRFSFKTILAFVLCTFSLFAAIGGSIAWFKSTYINQMNIGGSSQGAYFAYGTGVDGDPYGISNTRHLNNLAWLQYKGEFNKDKDGDGEPDHVYFELANDINKNGSIFSLPPIGTEEYPFVGVFDGNGHTIYNIKVTNNDQNGAFSDKPRNIDYSKNNAEVIGFFGVVGKIDEETSYSSSVNKLVNVTLDNITVESKTTNTLIGLAAGYVNAEMNGVKVGSSTISVNGNKNKALYSNNLSEYGLVGYSTKNGSKGSFTQKLSKYYDSSSQGYDPGWGGSIVIKDLYNRLSTIRSSYAKKDQSMAYSYNDVYDNSGKRLEHTADRSTTFDVYNEDYTKNNTVTYDEKIGAVQMVYSSKDTGGGIYYLAGGHYSTAKNSTYYNHNGYAIRNGDNYLQFDTTQTNKWKNENNPSKPTLWSIPSVGSTGNITTTYNGSTYYLQNSSGTLKVATSSSSSTSWKVESDSPSLVITNNNLKLDFNSNWVLNSAYYTTISYTSGGKTYYLKSSGGATAVTTTTKLDEASHWMVDSNNFYINTSDYLGLTYTTSGWLITSYDVANPAQAGSSGNFAKYNYSGGKLSVKLGGTLTGKTYYLNYNNGTLSASTSNSYTFSVDNQIMPSSITKGGYVSNQPGPDYKAATTNMYSKMTYSEDQDVTYLPLNVDTNLQAATGNTGYIIGGGAYSSATYSDGKYGNVRISSFYDIETNLQNYNQDDGCFDANTVWTYDSGGLHQINDTNNTYVKYKESKGQIETNLASGSNIYGLHFMSSEINKDNVVKAKYACINGETFSDYCMPANSIDFNLKDQGYVNFFAGAYGDIGGSPTTIDSFFSLHQIKRNGSNIDSINEIEEIYGDGIDHHSYIYKLSNGNYTIPYSIDKYNSKKYYVLNTKTLITSEYSDGIYHEISEAEFKASYESTFILKFNMSWLKDHSYSSGNFGFHQAFYFEIPVNPGEYALGTVAGRSYGAYLMYLDIGANAANQDKINAYALTTIQSGLDYPYGVDFNTTDVTGNAGGETLGIIIPIDSTGDMVFTVVDTTIEYASEFVATYAYSEKAVSGNSPPGPAAIPPSNGTRVIYGHIVATDSTEWDIRVTDILNAQGEVSSSSVTYVACGGEAVPVEDIPESFVINSVRYEVVTNIATFTRTSGQSSFNCLPDYGASPFTSVSVTIDVSGIIVEVSDIADGYTITVNGTPIQTDPQSITIN